MVPLSNPSQRDPRARPRPPHRQSAFSSFSRRRIPASRHVRARKTQDASGGVLVPWVGPPKQSGHAALFADALASTCSSKRTRHADFAPSGFGQWPASLRCPLNEPSGRNMEGGGLHVPTKAQGMTSSGSACGRAKPQSVRAPAPAQKNRLAVQHPLILPQWDEC